MEARPAEALEVRERSPQLRHGLALERRSENQLSSNAAIRHAYKQMLRQGGGQIATIASLAGLIPMPMSASYATTKAALVNFSHSLRCEGAGPGVQVSVVCPSFIETRIFDNAQYRKIDKQGLRGLIPLPFMTVDEAVRKMLAGIDANQATVVFPLHAKLLWWGQRLLPLVPNPLTNLVMRRARALKP